VLALKIFVIGLIINICFFAFGSSYSYADTKDFLQLRCDHFVINYHKAVDNNYILRVKNIAEKYYRIITQDFKVVRDELWLWDNRAKIFVAQDKESYLKEFGCFSWSSACVDYQGKIIYTYADQSRFIPIFIHELTHIIFREYVDKSGFKLWLDEGVAVYMEDRYGGKGYKEKLKFLSRAINKNNHIKLSELFNINSGTLDNKDGNYLNLFYLEAFSVVNFIVEKYGWHSFSNLLFYLKKSYNLEEALKRALYNLESIENLEEQWKKFYQK